MRARRAGAHPGECAGAPLEAPLAQAGTYRQDMEHAVPTGWWELLHCARGVNMLFVKDIRGCSTKEKVLEYCGAAPSTEYRLA